MAAGKLHLGFKLEDGVIMVMELVLDSSCGTCADGLEAERRRSVLTFRIGQGKRVDLD